MKGGEKMIELPDIKTELSQFAEKLNKREDYAALRETINRAVTNSGMSCLWVCKIEGQLLMSISINDSLQSTSEISTM
jgi:hypothetical protein